jgi:cytochrome c-type biogenesis protein CcmH/NrfG
MSLERTVELAPRHAVAWLNLAEARRATGDEAGALDAQRTAEELTAEP